LNRLAPYDPGQGEISRSRSLSQAITPSSAVDTPVSREADIGNLKRVFRRWPLLVAIAFVFAAIGFLVSRFIPTVYESDAEVLLQTPGQQQALSTAEQVAALAGFGGNRGSETDLPTQIEVMTSDQALETVAQRSGLSQNPAIARLSINITPHKTSGSIVMVSVRNASPNIAHAAAAALITVYNEHMAEESSTSNGREIMATKAQLASVTSKLSRAESDYVSYSSQVGSVDTTTDGVQKVTELYKLRDDQVKASQDLSAATSDFAVYQKIVATLDPTVVPLLSMVPSPQIALDESKLSDLEEQRYKLSAQYTPQDDEMVQNEQQIEAVRADIHDETERESAAASATMGTLAKSSKGQSLVGVTQGYIVNNITHATNPVREDALAKLDAARAQVYSDRQQIAALNSALLAADADMATTPAKYRKLADLQNDCLTYQKLYDELQSQLVQLDSQLPANQAYAEVLQLPSQPNVPIQPRPMLYSAASGLFGLLLGILLLLLVDYIDPSVRDATDIGFLADLPVLQSLPYYPQAELTAKSERLLGKGYQRLAATLAYQGLGSRIKTLALTSTENDEGSGVVAHKLAGALSGMGTKVIIVDATGPVLRIVPIESEPALNSSSAIGASDTTDNGLVVKPHPIAPLNVTTLLKSDDTASLIQHLKSEYDVIIFDAPAVFDGVRTAVLANQVDAIIYVSKVDGSSTRDEVRQALGLLFNASAPVLGVVLNDTRL
jgi:uncharacterized protein involved in exopolysaccharide biosynthesis/Mrp family chromosome partitioning ATPase